MALIQIERLKRLPLRRDHVWQTALVRRPTRVTQEAKLLKAWQQANGLEPDGIAGRNTYRSLGLLA